LNDGDRDPGGLERIDMTALSFDFAGSAGDTSASSAGPAGDFPGDAVGS
jgi:hypothetical protein